MILHLVQNIARVAVAALIDPERHDGYSYRPTGPELLSGRDITNKIAGVLNRRVQLVEMPPAMFLRALRAIDYPIYMQLCVSSYIEEHRQGAFALTAPTDHVLKTSGIEAEAFEVTAARYATTPDAQRNFRNTFREISNFMKIAITPSLDFEKYKREQFHPRPAKPLFAMQDEIWKQEHGVAFLENASQAFK